MIIKLFNNGGGINWIESFNSLYYLGSSRLEGKTILAANNSEEDALIIGADGTTVIRGNIKNVAEAIFHYAAKEFQDGLVTMVINDVIRYNFSNGISIEFIGENKPEFFDELASEVKRFSDLKAFS